MRAILITRTEAPEVIEIENTLEALQEAVNGYIEVLSCPVEGTNIICNEEGKLRGLPKCMAWCDKDGKVLDMLVGHVLIVGTKGEDFADLTDEQIKEATEYADYAVYGYER